MKSTWKSTYKAGRLFQARSKAGTSHKRTNNLGKMGLAFRYSRYQEFNFQVVILSNFFNKSAMVI